MRRIIVILVCLPMFVHAMQPGVPSFVYPAVPVCQYILRYDRNTEKFISTSVSKKQMRTYHTLNEALQGVDLKRERNRRKRKRGDNGGSRASFNHTDWGYDDLTRGSYIKNPRTLN